MYSLTEHVREAIANLAPKRSTTAVDRMKSPSGIGTVILLALTVVGIIWVFPELRRYVRMTRM